MRRNAAAGGLNVQPAPASDVAATASDVVGVRDVSADLCDETVEPLGFRLKTTIVSWNKITRTYHHIVR